MCRYGAYIDPFGRLSFGGVTIRRLFSCLNPSFHLW
jgi:hypothetical protein